VIEGEETRVQPRLKSRGFYFRVMTRLFLIRHGETDYNLNRRYCGFSDLSLNETGRSQVQFLAERLKEFKIDTLYSSDLLRAVETAKIIFKDKTIHKMQEFREMNFGIFEGLNFVEIVEKSPKIYRRWIDNPLEVDIPEGETFTDFCNRVKKGLSFILSKNQDKQISLITHSGPIKVILCELLGCGLDKFWDLKQDNTALNIIDYPEGSSPVIIKMNNMSHLSCRERAL